MKKFTLLLMLLMVGIFMAQSGNVGINTISPASTLVVNGSFAAQYKSVSASSYALAASDYYVSYNGTSNASFTLPVSVSGAGNFKGRIYTIKNNSTYTLTVNAATNETIGGNADITIPAGQSAGLISTGLTGATSTWELSGYRPNAAPITTASNGLTISGSDVRLGGTLSQATDIATEGYNLTLSGTGNIGIGTTAAPTSKLEVNGSSANTAAYNASSATTIDFSKSNLAYTSAVPGAFTLQNIKDGGTYTLAVRGSGTGTASFAATGFTAKYINNRAATANTHTLYTLVVMGTVIYVYMAVAV